MPEPADQPFVVRAHHGRRTLLLGGVTFPAVAGTVGIVAWAMGLGFPVLPLLALLACPAALLLAFLAYHIQRMIRPIVLLAAGPAGLWLRSDGPFTQTVHLRWEDVERVSLVHWRLFDRVLVVTPRDPSGRTAATGRGLIGNLYGVGFRVRISLVDRSPSDILAALAYYSAGRCSIA